MRALDWFRSGCEKRSVGIGGGVECCGCVLNSLFFMGHDVLYYMEV